MATINNLPLLTNIVPARICFPVTCSNVTGATYRLPLSTVIALGKGNTGYTGSIGTTGAPGNQGLRGFAGSIGIQGFRGYTGSASTGTALQGLRGYTGSAAVSPIVNLSTITNSLLPVSSDIVDLGAYNKSWRSVYTNQLYVNTGNIRDLQTGLPIAFATSGTTGGGYTGSAGPQGVRGFTGSNGSVGPTGPTGGGYTGSRGSTGTVGYTGSVGPTGPAGIGYTGSRGSTGTVGYTGSAGAGGIQIYEEDISIGVYTALNFVGLSVTASTQTSNIAAITISGTGGGGYLGSRGPTGPQGPMGYYGSVGPTGPMGYYGSAGSVNTLANGTYTIGTLYVSTLTVSSVGAATIQSGNDLNLKAVGQITVNAPFVLTNATTSSLASLSGITQIGAMVFVTNYSGGAQPCYFDGVHWYTVNGRVRVD